MKAPLASQPKPRVSLLYLGGHFLPLEILKRRLSDEVGVSWQSITRPENITREAKNGTSGLYVVFHEHADETESLKNLMQALKPLLESGSAALCLIAARNAHWFSHNYRGFKTVSVLPVTIQAPELLNAITALLSAIKSPTNKAQGTAVGPTDTKETQFQQVAKPGLVRELFEEAIHSKVHISLFDEKLTVQFQGQVKRYRSEPQSVSLQLVSSHDARDIVMRAAGQPLLVNMNLNRCRTFFRSASYLVEDANTLQLNLTDPIYEIQRRAHMRLRLAKEPEVTFHLGLPDVAIRGKGLDISAGGMAVALEVDIARHLRAGSKLTQLRLDLGPRDLIVPACHVRHVGQPTTTPDGRSQVRLGLQFAEMKPRDVQFLNMFVYRESLKSF